MKTNTKHKKPFHLHVEHFFRKQYCLLGVLGLLVIAIAKADDRTMSVVRNAYLHGYGLIGQYMREETTRVPVTFEIGTRSATYSGK